MVVCLYVRVGTVIKQQPASCDLESRKISDRKLMDGWTGENVVYSVQILLDVCCASETIFF